MKKINPLLDSDVTKGTVCTCMCHNEGMEVLHCMPCCDLTYEKYMVDGKVDIVKWTELKQKLRDNEDNNNV